MPHRHITGNTVVTENQFEDVEIILNRTFNGMGNNRLASIKLVHKPADDQFRFLRTPIIGTSAAMAEIRTNLSARQYTFIHLPSRARITEVRLVKGRVRRDGRNAVVLILHYTDRSGKKRRHEEFVDVPED